MKKVKNLRIEYNHNIITMYDAASSLYDIFKNEEFNGNMNKKTLLSDCRRHVRKCNKKLIKSVLNHFVEMCEIMYYYSNSDSTVGMIKNMNFVFEDGSKLPVMNHVITDENMSLIASNRESLDSYSGMPGYLYSMVRYVLLETFLDQDKEWCIVMYKENTRSWPVNYRKEEFLQIKEDLYKNHGIKFSNSHVYDVGYLGRSIVIDEVDEDSLMMMKLSKESHIEYYTRSDFIEDKKNILKIMTGGK